MNLSDMAREMLSSDFPGVYSVTFANATTNALLSRKYIETENMAGLASVLSVPEDVSQSITIGEPITVNGANFTVAENQPDGAGMANLILEAVE